MDDDTAPVGLLGLLEAGRPLPDVLPSIAPRRDEIEVRLQLVLKELADSDAALQRALDRLPLEAIITALIEKHGRAQFKAAANRAGAAPVPIVAHGIVVMTVKLCRSVNGETIEDAAKRIARLGGLPKIRDRIRPSEAVDMPFVFGTASAIRAAYYRAEEALDAEAARHWPEVAGRAALALEERYRESGVRFDDWLRRLLARWRKRYEHGTL